MNETVNIDFILAVKNMKDNMLAHIEYHQLRAKILKARYDSYLKEGFSEAMAMWLLKEIS